MAAIRTKNIDWWLVILWLAVAIAGPMVLIIFVAGLPLAYRELSAVCSTNCGDSRILTPAAGARWQAAGLSLAVYGALGTGLSIALAVLCFTIAGFLLLKRPKDRMTVFVALEVILLGGLFGSGDELVGQQVTWLARPVILLNQASVGLLPILFLTFPTGRFVPRWSRWPALVFLLGFTIPNIIVGDTVYVPIPLVFVFLFFLAVLCPLSQLFRYRRVSNLVEKAQTRWVAAGFSVAVGGLVATVISGFLAGIPEQAGPFVMAANQVAGYVFIAVIPISLMIGVLRYRLWDIDVIIRRTLVYAVLTALLALTYFGTVIVLQAVFGSLLGEQSPVVIVISTLVIAALFGTLRRRVQSIIDRRFFRQKYNAEQVLARFAQSARDEVELEALTAEMVRIVEETMRPEQVSLWLRKTE